MLNRVMRVALVAVAVAASAQAGRADFVIDTFDVPTPADTYSLAGAVGSTFTSVDNLPGNIVRTLTVTQTVNQLGNAGATSGVIGNGVYSLSTSAGTTAFTSLLYSYESAQDLSASGTAVQFTFDFADLNTPFTVIISDGTTSASQSGSVSSSTTGTFSLDLSGFQDINLANIQSIELLLNSGSGEDSSTVSADLILSDVRINTPDAPPPPVIPAPPALALFAAALPALGLARRYALKA